MDLKISKSGARTYLQMTESYRHRNSGKPRWRHIANLGRMDKLVEADLDSLIEGLLKVIGRPSLAQVEASTGEQAATFEQAVEIGDIWAVMQIWHQLALGQSIARMAQQRSFRFDMAKLVRVMVVNYLSDPFSKLGLLEWLETVALPGIDVTQVTHSNLLRAMDWHLSQGTA